ncbi:hypothetical protein C5167_029857 [Papaver somniferum]|nr:hypothetical protein C5167_029857 [Papaver somniferum]
MILLSRYRMLKKSRMQFFRSDLGHLQEMMDFKQLFISNVGILLVMRSRQKNCQGIIDNMNNRLQGWQSKITNQAGRTIQVNVVLNTKAKYQMQVFKLPDSTIQQMEKIQRSYWWNNFSNNHSQHFISWDKLHFPKRLGGLGLKNLTNYNLAFLAKLAWQLLHNQEALWAEVLKGNHFPHNDLNFFPPSTHTNSSWIWQSTCLGIQIIMQNAKWQVGKGNDINIWTANWIPSLESSIQNWDDLNTRDYQWVSELIDADSGQWNILLLRQLFSPAQWFKPPDLLMPFIRYDVTTLPV